MSETPNESRIRTVIADDEPFARERLRSLLAEEPDVEIVGECASGRSLVAAVERSSPDLVFLDVQMPALDGFGAIATLGLDRMPLVVFVTAYESYALKAFEVRALDYLLKPFDRDRFRETMDRVRVHTRARRAGDLRGEILALLGGGGRASGREPVERLFVRDRDRGFFLRTESIDWVEAASNYASLHVGTETYLVRETMGSLESRLDGRRFLRIHRSTIVNVDRVREFQVWTNGEYLVVMRDGTELTMSRTYRERFERGAG